MKMGRIRVRVEFRIASSGVIPWARTSWTVYVTNRMALFTTVPMRMMNPSMVNMSSGCRSEAGRTTVFKIHNPSMPPAVASGTDSMMIKG